ncbi:ADP-ribosylglycohydrolase family protein [Paenibacillus sp. WC2504]|uniref:ADP-ribosylglycohydrolase family protein n=1 Tax=Paenibacillus sp. WC2504 TaxID=3461403 RepID=UPI004046438C
MSENISLKEKFYGCIAGTYVGAAMGAPVEGMSHQEIEAKYGVLNTLLPYERNNNGWIREAGTTEDGVERQKLMTTAILAKQDRVNAEDIRSIWVRDIKPNAGGMITEPFENTLLAVAKSGIPARDIGKYCDYAGLSSASGSCQPIGLINAGDVRNAVADAFEIGQLYQTSKSYAVRWAGVSAAAIASATKPGATVDSVIGDIFRYCDYTDLALKIDGNKYGYLRDNVIQELDSGLKRTAHCKDFGELREAFDKIYYGCGVPYCNSFANEALTKAICILRLVNGNAYEAILAGVNMGRDTGAVAAIAGGLAGALKGAGSISAELIKQVDDATSLNPYTNNERTIQEQADGLYRAFHARLQKINTFTETMLAV